MKRRFPWWVYLLAAFFACGIIGTIFKAPQPAPAVPSSQASAGLGLPALVQTPTEQSARPTLQSTSTTPPAQPAAPAAPPADNPNLTQAVVKRVVDGDTLVVEIAGQLYRVRLIGMDTPETVDPARPVMCFGAEATRKTQELVDLAGGQVMLEKDVSETDKYDRLLRYVWLKHPDGTRMLNEELVKWGYAQVSTYPPDVKYQDQFVAVEREARGQNRGLWAACSRFGAPVATPTTSRSARPAPTTPPAAPAVPQPAPSGGGVKISYVYYDGQEPTTEGDEYVVIANGSGKPVNLAGYRINAGDRGQDFRFPSFVLNPGQEIRVYTNRDIPGSFSFNYGRAIWNNKGDCGHLYDAGGKEISQYCY